MSKFACGNGPENPYLIAARIANRYVHMPRGDRKVELKRSHGALNAFSRERCCSSLVEINIEQNRI